MADQPEASGAEYFLESFPREDFPRYVWTERPGRLPEEVWTTETTHRDGQQGGIPFDLELGVEVYDLLCRFTSNSGAIRQAEFFIYHSSDRAMLSEALERWKDGSPIEPTTWIRATPKDVELVASVGIRETGMLASSSDYHTFHKFSPGGRQAASNVYLDAVRAALDAGIKPRLHLEDATRASTDFILGLAEASLLIAERYGPDLRPKFRVCDTMGIGLPYDDVSLPRSVPRIFRGLRAMGLASSDLEFHPHNDTWMVVATCLAAVREGCGAINGCCLGKGERTGNAPLEAVIMHLIGMGYFRGARPDFAVLNELAELYEKRGETIAPQYPLFGRDAHRTRAGVHADGLNKYWPMYSAFDVPALLGRRLEVSITKESGLAGLIFLARQHLGIDLSKNDPALLSVHKWVERQFEEGREAAIDWPELEPFFSRSLRDRSTRLGHTDRAYT